MEVTQAELNRWKQDPVTKKVFMNIAFTVEEMKEMLVNGVEDYDWTRGFICGMRVLFNLEGGTSDDGESEA